VEQCVTNPQKPRYVKLFAIVEIVSVPVVACSMWAVWFPRFRIHDNKGRTASITGQRGIGEVACSRA
jgi:hypothetical protein